MIEGGEVGINNQGGTIGNVSYLSKIEGTGSTSSYGIENTGTMGEIDNTGVIDSLSSTDIGIENTGTIGVFGTEVTTYGINNNGTIGNIDRRHRRRRDRSGRDRRKCCRDRE